MSHEVSHLAGGKEPDSQFRQPKGSFLSSSGWLLDLRNPPHTHAAISTHMNIDRVVGGLQISPVQLSPPGPCPVTLDAWVSLGPRVPLLHSGLPSGSSWGPLPVPQLETPSWP